MIFLTRHSSRQALACLALASTFATAYAADEAATAAAPAPAESAAPALPAPNPAAEKALNQRFQAILSAFEGKGAMPDAKSFSDEFNKQATPEQIKEVLQQVRQSVGSCRLVAQVRSPLSFAGSYLLQCDKAFVPVDMAVEEKAPYRIHSLLIRSGYWKK